MDTSPRWAITKLGATNFLPGFLCECRESKNLGHLLFSWVHQQGAVLEVEHSKLKFASRRDATVSGSDFTHCTKMPQNGHFSFSKIYPALFPLVGISKVSE